jgi:uncharacterized membrane protein YcaP (DUF421 family)
VRTSREHVDVGATSWTHIFTFEIPIWEKILRTIVVYAAIVILLRVMGKRNLAQVNTFDLVVIFLLSNVVQNAIIGPDNSLGGGLVGAAVLIVVNNIVVRLAARNDRLGRWLDGEPTELVHDGIFDDSAVESLGLRHADVMASLRHQGVSDLSDVHTATLDPNGAITVSLEPSAQPATKADIDEIMRRLDDLARPTTQSS